MKVKLKKVYYCEFCKKHGLRSLAKHELHCTANPNRECQLVGCMKHDLNPIIEKFKIDRTKLTVNIPELDDIKNDVGECPNCLLTVVRCANLSSRIENFDYKKEREQWWAAVNEDAQRTDEWSSMYG